MLERGKISPLQMAMMMYATVLATIILTAPAPMVKEAKQDVWISTLLASIPGFLIVVIAYWLHKLYPGKTLIEYCTDILGKAAGKIVALLFLLFYLHICGIIIREYGDFVVGAFLSRTPIAVVMGSMLLVCAYAVRSGLEVIARSSQIIIPVVVLLFLFVPAMLLPELDPDQLLPIMAQGIKPSFRGALVAFGWYVEFVLISFMLPYIKKRRKILMWSGISVLSVMTTAMITNVMLLMLFGQTVSSHTYPVMAAARYISLADFFEHVESFVMAIWVASVFIKISVFYYAISLGTAQWLNLSDFRPIVWPIGFLLLLLSIWSAPNMMDLNDYLSFISPFYTVLVQLIIPLLLLTVALIRKGWSKRKAGGQS